MKLTFLGAGDMFAIDQGHNSVLIEFNESNLVIDFPETNFRALRALGKDLTDVRNVFITHLHEDHVNGLQLLGNYARVYSKNKPNLFVHSSLFDQLWQTLKAGIEPSGVGPKELSDYFNVHIVEDQFEIEGVSFKPIRTHHLPGMISHGLFCTPYFYFSSDCALDKELLLNYGGRVKTIFHECHLQEDVLKSHTSLEEILELPQELRSKVVLMHYEDTYSKPENRRALEERTGLNIAGPLSVYEF
jgi:ribonuclease BN (tRNA processing enzyme)